MAPLDMHDELAALRAENARLTGLLVAHGIAWRALVPAVQGPLPAQEPATSGASLAPSCLSPADKVALFGRLFRGRTGADPLRWVDDAEWRDNARAFMRYCRKLGVPAALGVSRSGHGAHGWVFFAGRVSAQDARRLGTALISHIGARTWQCMVSPHGPGVVSQPASQV